MTSHRWLKFPECCFNSIFRKTGKFFKYGSVIFFPFFPLEIGHFHYCTVNTDEGKDWLGGLETEVTKELANENVLRGGCRKKNKYRFYTFL